MCVVELLAGLVARVTEEQMVVQVCCVCEYMCMCVCVVEMLAGLVARVTEEQMVVQVCCVCEYVCVCECVCGGGAGRPGCEGDRGADGSAGVLCVCDYVCVSVSMNVCVWWRCWQAWWPG